MNKIFLSASLLTFIILLPTIVLSTTIAILPTAVCDVKVLNSSFFETIDCSVFYKDYINCTSDDLQQTGGLWEKVLMESENDLIVNETYRIISYNARPAHFEFFNLSDPSGNWTRPGFFINFIVIEDTRNIDEISRELCILNAQSRENEKDIAEQRRQLEIVQIFAIPLILPLFALILYITKKLPQIAKTFLEWRKILLYLILQVPMLIWLTLSTLLSLVPYFIFPGFIFLPFIYLATVFTYVLGIYPSLILIIITHTIFSYLISFFIIFTYDKLRKKK